MPIVRPLAAGVRIGMIAAVDAEAGAGAVSAVGIGVIAGIGRIAVRAVSAVTGEIVRHGLNERHSLHARIRALRDLSRPVKALL